MRKYAIFIKKSLKVNLLRIKDIAKLEIIFIIQVNIKVLHIAYIILNESVKLHTLRAHEPTCLACLCVLVSTCLECLRAYLLTCLAWLYALAYLVCSSANVSCVLTSLRTRVLCMLSCSLAKVPYVLTPVSMSCMPTCSRAITSDNKNYFSITCFT